MTQATSTFNPDPALPVLQDIHHTFGMVPNLFRAYAKHPALLEANWNKTKAVLLGGGVLRQTKEIMALMVSLDNGCAYCIAAHSVALQNLGMERGHINALLLGLYPSEFTASDVELIKFARKVNLHWRDISDKDISTLKQMGIAETDIIETIGIVELLAGFNRFARTMQVEVDF
ncbi:MAG: peroxidase [Betaproteobacteria bacterium HGW-Betaproteobacteria-2]|jgi:uncharacterized peroxidase-related enzyme|nr:MAG: peroxidase [Betaproteobacteria bacterium HGW-Betaproteobacteria-2]